MIIPYLNMKTRRFRILKFPEAGTFVQRLGHVTYRRFCHRVNFMGLAISVIVWYLYIWSCQTQVIFYNFQQLKLPKIHVHENLPSKVSRWRAYQTASFALIFYGSWEPVSSVSCYWLCLIYSLSEAYFTQENVPSLIPMP